MSNASPNAEPTTDAVRARLRLKRVFLRTLVLSLTACALVAVVALLVGKFNDTTARILLTLGALALHSGIAMACVHSLERRRWPKLSVTGLVLFAANFALLITCIWWGRLSGDSLPKGMSTTGALIVLYILAIPGASLQERRVYPLLGLAGLLTCVVAFAMTLTCIWAEHADNEAFAKATAIAAIIAFSFAHTALLAHVPASLAVRWLLGVALFSLWTVAAMVSAAIIWELQADGWYRVMGAVGVVDASASLALIIMALLRRVGKVEKLQSADVQVELHCPRCTTLQKVAVGASRCSACGLKFRLEVEEPRCAKCDYLLWQLTERRCPECGTAF